MFRSLPSTSGTRANLLSPFVRPTINTARIPLDSFCILSILVIATSIPLTAPRSATPFDQQLGRIW